MEKISMNVREKLTRKKRLAAYSAAAGAVMGLANTADAQVVFTDVDPDTTIMNGGAYLLDLNNDGIIDFDLSPGTFTYYSQPVGYAVIVADSSNPNGSFIGSAKFYSSLSTSFSVPYALTTGANINSTAQWIAATSSSPGFFAASFANSIYWGQWANVGNRYVGLRFQITGNTHYGWARLSVDTSNWSMTIQGYAYEQSPDTEILAGEGSPTGIANANGWENNIMLYSFDNNIHLNFRNEAEPNGKVSVYNLLGQEVYSKAVTGRKMQLSIPDAKGSMYLVKVEMNGTAVSRKVYLKEN